MGLMDELLAEQETKPTGGTRCQMCVLTDPAESPLGPEDAAGLGQALRNPGITASTVIDVLRRHGVETTVNRVGNHRRAHMGMRIR